MQSRVTANGRVGATAAVYSAAILGARPAPKFARTRSQRRLRRSISQCACFSR